VSALVPLAELTEYAVRLKSLTAGEGTYTLDLSHYETVPPRRQQELSTAWQRHPRSA
jgi:elongation factor G